MSLSMTCPDVAAVLCGLKDFQRDTVGYVFRRMYLDPDYTRRFLIADEVGLGKTLVARGLIAKAIEHLQAQGVQRVDVVYICSNAEIARQNIARLNVMGCEEFQLASRITLLPTRLHKLNSRPVNFISFTPGTSFNLHSNLGIGEERTLLFNMLKDAWGLRGAGPLNVFQGGMGKDAFRNRAAQFRTNNQVDVTLEHAFIETLAADPSIRDQFDELCSRFARHRIHIPANDRQDRAAFIGMLRMKLTLACLKALEPDLIILDEFQRFKHLLNPSDPAGQLAKELFNYSDQHTESRVVMLSATPYKMYTVTDDAGGEDHYADFLETLRFLQDNAVETATFEQTISEYRHELLRLRGRDCRRLCAVKDALEAQLRRVMARTERLAITVDRDGMLTERACGAFALSPSDVQGYLQVQQVARAIGMPEVMDYWKSAPYLLSFMDEYKLKQTFRDRIVKRDTKLAAALQRVDGVSLAWPDIEGYASIDPANPRLRSLLADTVDAGAWQWLWMPPSMPYYRLAGRYQHAARTGFTKRLIFTAWQVAPKAIATLVSYEAERQMFRCGEVAPVNTPEARRRRRPLLRFAFTDGRLTGMPILALMYPSAVLAEIGDPLRRMDTSVPLKSLPALSTLLREVGREIETRLTPIVGKYAAHDTVDDAWYWAAPVLLDLETAPEHQQWLQRANLASIWGGQSQTSSRDEDDDSRWTEHVLELQRVATRRLGRPPKDLVKVLALLAIAGPGPAVLRALTGVARCDLSAQQLGVRDAAAQVAYQFRALFNLPETMAMLRSAQKREPYWRVVLDYCADGGLSAVLDEYAHILRESCGLFDHPADEIASGVAGRMCDAVTLRTSSVDVDEITVDEEQVPRVTRRSMRGRFALRFGHEQNADDQETTRQEKVREAFNSPFWPFVLATTSIGQEGLDFHPYCHAIVHWNLPSNPVDLEQREGRVHRYKGHAVRKNLARRYGVPAVNGSRDPWEILFNCAVQDRAPDASDLLPFWIYPITNGATIERYVPALPLSRDKARYAQLRRALAVYRMVFGQSRQEDLLTFLLEHLSERDAQAVADQLRINLSPPSSVAEVVGSTSG